MSQGGSRLWAPRRPDRPGELRRRLRPDPRQGADAERIDELWRRHPVPVVVVCDGCDRGAMDHLPSSWSCLTEPVSRADLEAAIWTAIGNFDRLSAAFGELSRIERELEGGRQPEENCRDPSDLGGEQ